MTIAQVLLARFEVTVIRPSSVAHPLDYPMLAALLTIWLITFPENPVMTVIGLKAALFVVSDVATHMAEYPFSF